MSSKILQIIHVPDLLAVLGDETGFYTVKVSHVRLVEDFQQGGDGNHKFVRHEVPVIPWRGKLTGCDEVPDFLGVASSQNEARFIGVRAMSEEARTRYYDEQRESIPCSFSEMTRRSEAERARSDQGVSITQCVN